MVSSAASSSPIGFWTSMWMAKKTKLFASAPQKRGAQSLVGQQPDVVVEARERPPSVRPNRLQPQRVEQREDHEHGVDQRPPVQGTRRGATGTTSAARRGRCEPVAIARSALGIDGSRPPRRTPPGSQSDRERAYCGWLVPACPGQSWISLAGLFRGQRAVDDGGADAPQLVLEVGFATRQDLVRVADRGLARLPRGRPPPGPAGRPS